MTATLTATMFNRTIVTEHPTRIDALQRVADIAMAQNVSIAESEWIYRDGPHAGDVAGSFTITETATSPNVHCLFCGEHQPASNTECRECGSDALRPTSNIKHRRPATMTAMTALDAVRTIAQANHLTEVFDSGPVDVGKVTIFGDADFARDYLHGRCRAGVAIEVTFNPRGEVRSAHMLSDGELVAEVTIDARDAGTRLLGALQMFDEAGLRTPHMPREESDEDHERRHAASR